jgi:NADP-dependent 3-hydroxy acid dehydrogenase YdfG
VLPLLQVITILISVVMVIIILTKILFVYVVGGSRGLGLQCALALGVHGAKVVITARKAHELEQAEQILTKNGIDCIAFPTDLQNAKTIPDLVGKSLDKYGSVDILINNAGATWGAPAESHPADAWKKVIQFINAEQISIPPTIYLLIVLLENSTYFFVICHSSLPGYESQC